MNNPQSPNLVSLDSSQSSGTSSSKEHGVLLSQLELIHKTVLETYSTTTNWTRIVAVADVLLVTYGVTQRVELVIIGGATLVLMLVYLFYRAGHLLTMLMTKSLSIEKRLNITTAISVSSALIVSLHGSKALNKIKSYAYRGDSLTASDMDYIARYSMFSLKTSPITLLIFCVAVFQTVIPVYLVSIGYFTFT